MPKPPQKGPTDLEGLLDQLEDAGNGGKEISLREVRDAIGRRAFAPLLLLVSLLGFTPLGGIPGVPTTLAVIVILIAGQVALSRRHLWVPAFLLDRHIERRKLEKSARALKPIARAIDKVIWPRLTFLTEPPWSAVLALACVLLALTVPPFEFIPFIDLPLWGAMVAFSLALFAHDGVLAIIAFVLTAAGIVLAAMTLL
jgi:hypothetical protein